MVGWISAKTFDNEISFDLSDYEVNSAPLELGYSFTQLSRSSRMAGGFTFITEIGDDDDDYDQDCLEAEWLVGVSI